MATPKTLTLKFLVPTPPVDLAVYSLNDKGVVEVKILVPEGKIAKAAMRDGAVDPKTKKMVMPKDGAVFLAALKAQVARSTYYSLT